MCHHLNFHSRVFRQCGDLNRGARREIFREIPRVNLIHAREVGEVRHENRGFNDIRERQLLVVQNRFHVLQDALGLGLDVAGNQVAGGRVNRDLAGAEQQIADAHGVVVRADGGGRFGRFDDLFGWHRFERQCCGFARRGQAADGMDLGRREAGRQSWRSKLISFRTLLSARGDL